MNLPRGVSDETVIVHPIQINHPMVYSLKDKFKQSTNSIFLTDFSKSFHNTKLLIYMLNYYYGLKYFFLSLFSTFPFTDHNAVE